MQLVSWVNCDLTQGSVFFSASKLVEDPQMSRRRGQQLDIDECLNYLGENEFYGQQLFPRTSQLLFHHQSLFQLLVEKFNIWAERIKILEQEEICPERKTTA